MLVTNSIKFLGEIILYFIAYSKNNIVIYCKLKLRSGSSIKESLRKTQKQYE